ncbi:MAG: DUF2911 domain-containing protein [Flavobacteriaceae bacterium]|nr:DUF2911 domain-containing protein [Flavobacteriaceae bacterium]
MKTNSTFKTIALTFLMLFSLSITAQKFKDLDKSPMDAAAFPSSYKIAEKAIKIIYSRPQLKGRTLSKLAPNGKVWRTGANEAPELTLYKDMMLGSTKIPAGTYTFYMIPGEKEWTAIISKDINAWGSYFYDEANDIARLTVPVTKDESSLEAFSIAFNASKKGVTMHLGWGTTRVAVPFSN